MKVFAIIVTYNGMKWIDQCLKSIVNQCEVIVVDNNSSDEIINYIKENFTSVNILPQSKNHGFGIANNIGINYALKNGADAVFLLNQDAFAQTNCVINLISAHNQNQDYGILSPIHLNGDGSAVDYSFLTFTSPYKASNLISDLIIAKSFENIYPIKFINAAAWFIPKRVFYKIGGFDPLFFLYGEDDNYCQRVLYHGFKIGIIPNATIFHDSNNSNFRRGKSGSEKYFRQIINEIHVKYANVNTNSHKKLRRFKFYILRKGILKLIAFDFFESRLQFKKYNRIKLKNIMKSVEQNKLSNSNYLEI